MYLAHKDRKFRRRRENYAYDHEPNTKSEIKGYNS